MFFDFGFEMKIDTKQDEAAATTQPEAQKMTDFKPY